MSQHVCFHCRPLFFLPRHKFRSVEFRSRGYRFALLSYNRLQRLDLRIQCTFIVLYPRLCAGYFLSQKCSRPQKDVLPVQQFLRLPVPFIGQGDILRADRICDLSPAGYGKRIALDLLFQVSVQLRRSPAGEIHSVDLRVRQKMKVKIQRSPQICRYQDPQDRASGYEQLLFQCPCLFCIIIFPVLYLLSSPLHNSSPLYHLVDT